MREVDRLLDQLQRTYGGDAWFGPSVRAALEGVDARTAGTRQGAAHTIAEIVLHMTAWTREVTRRLDAGVARAPLEGDWPDTGARDERAWTAAVASLDDANAALAEAIGRLSDARLEDWIGDARDRALGSGVSVYVMLHGLVQHHAYHAGQISMLKRTFEATLQPDQERTKG